MNPPTRQPTYPPTRLPIHPPTHPPIHPLPLPLLASYDEPTALQVAMFEYLRPRSLATTQEVIEYLELHQAAQEFRLELEHRASLEQHCQWYYQVAAENQRDLEQMRSELNLLRLFNRRSV